MKGHHIPAVALALCMTTACAPEILSDYALIIDPRIPENLDPFGRFPHVKLVFFDETGTTIEYLDQTITSSVGRRDFGPLDGTRIGLMLEATGGDENLYNAPFLIAYGEVGPFSLGTGLETVEVTVLLPNFGEVGDLGTLSESFFLADSVLTSSGDVLLFGGAPSFDADSKSDRMWKLTDLDAGDWSFTSIGSLPEEGVRQSATVVQTDAGELIFVAGGQATVESTLGSSKALLVDPEDGTITWESGATDKLGEGRGGHIAIAMNDGKVLLVGGYDESGMALDQATYELFDPNTTTTDYQNDDYILMSPSLGTAGVSLGTDGALVCGGATHDLTTDWVETPSDACRRITVAGDLRDVASMPTAVQAHAMALLGDGRVLVTGGITQTITHTGSETAVAPAIADAWIYDPNDDSWSTITPMSEARAHHRAISTPDGRVVIVGGSAEGSEWSNYGLQVDTTEIYDPSTDSWQTMSANAKGTGAGAHPIVAEHPQHGAVVVSGINRGRVGGTEYGIIGFGPTL